MCSFLLLFDHNLPLLFKGDIFRENRGININDSMTLGAPAPSSGNGNKTSAIRQYSTDGEKNHGYQGGQSNGFNDRDNSGNRVYKNGHDRPSTSSGKLIYLYILSNSLHDICIYTRIYNIDI